MQESGVSGSRAGGRAKAGAGKPHGDFKRCTISPEQGEPVKPPYSCTLTFSQATSRRSSSALLVQLHTLHVRC